MAQSRVKTDLNGAEGMNVLITGGAGFIGSHYVERIMENESVDQVITLDFLTYAGDKDNLKHVMKNPKHVFVHGDICDRSLLEEVFRKYDIESVVHFAAETHVDRSIEDGHPFVMTNVAGTQMLLDVAKQYWQIGLKEDGSHRYDDQCRFVHISTDEVYGSNTKEIPFTEKAHFNPSNPYAATKVGAEAMVKAYQTTYNFPAITVRCGNNYGPRQNEEKLIPTVIIKALENEAIPIYGNGLQVRDWIYVKDCVTAIEQVRVMGRLQEVYNICANDDRTNLETVNEIIKVLGSQSDILHIKDRLGHDTGYYMSSEKIRKQLGWRPLFSFEEGLRMTVAYYNE